MLWGIIGKISQFINRRKLRSAMSESCGNKTVGILAEGALAIHPGGNSLCPSWFAITQQSSPRSFMITTIRIFSQNRAWYGQLTVVTIWVWGALCGGFEIGGANWCIVEILWHRHKPGGKQRKQASTSSKGRNRSARLFNLFTKNQRLIQFRIHW
jgi:hypothetical protein